MAKIRIWLRAVFGFSRTESNGFIILLPLLVIIVLSEPLSRWIVSNRPLDTTGIAVLDSVSKTWTLPDRVSAHVVQIKNTNNSLFPFDPNTASATSLKSLGFSDHIVSGLIHYREKGGRLKVKSDLLKIYGVDSTLYRHLYSFIKLPEKAEVKVYAADATSKERIKTLFDLNTADTMQLKDVYGIGSKLASRIVSFRQRLGGFVSNNQLYEVYGLDSAVVIELLKSAYLDDHFQPAKININTITGNELKLHPYLDKKLAKTLATYRFQHGNFKQVEDIRSLHIVPKEIADKIIPYLTVE